MDKETVNYRALEARRLRRGWSRVHLAALAEVSPTTITRVLQGETSHPPTVRRIAEALGLTMDDVLSPKGE